MWCQLFNSFMKINRTVAASADSLTLRSSLLWSLCFTGRNVPVRFDGQTETLRLLCRRTSVTLLTLNFYHLHLSCWWSRPSCPRRLCRCLARPLCCPRGRCPCLWFQRTPWGCWAGCYCCCWAADRGAGPRYAWRASLPARFPRLWRTPSSCRPEGATGRVLIYFITFLFQFKRKAATRLHQVHVAVDATRVFVHQVLQVLALVRVGSCMES